MNIKFSRLLMAPVLAGALFGVALADTQGTVEAAGPRWKGYAKPAGVDCRFVVKGKFDVEKAKDDAFRESFKEPIEDSGSICGTSVKNKTWADIKQYGKFNQANAALFAQNIVQLNNTPDGNNPHNEANNNYVGVGNNTSDDAGFVQSNINVNKNRIKDSGNHTIDIDVRGEN